MAHTPGRLEEDSVNLKPEASLSYRERYPVSNSTKKKWSKANRMCTELLTSIKKLINL